MHKFNLLIQKSHKNSKYAKNPYFPTSTTLCRMVVEQAMYKNLDDHIINIVQHHSVSRQSVLQELLEGRNIHIPQSTLSRRIKKLGIIKKNGAYAIPAHAQQMPTILSINVSHQNGLIVIHTMPGAASGFAYFFDTEYKNAPHTQVMGTIAGDDNVLIVSKSTESAAVLLSILQKDFPHVPIK